MDSMAGKIESAQEVQALRRVINAYLNYSSAAEADISRWERSFTKLKPSHQSLLPHLPKKYKDLRRCVAKNSHFIQNMLQAFVPPFEMEDFHGWDDVGEDNAGYSNFSFGRGEESENRNGFHLSVENGQCGVECVSNTSLGAPGFYPKEVKQGNTPLEAPVVHTHVSKECEALHSSYDEQETNSQLRDSCNGDHGNTAQRIKPSGSLGAPTLHVKGTNQSNSLDSRSTEQNTNSRVCVDGTQEDIEFGLRPASTSGATANGFRAHTSSDFVERGYQSTCSRVQDPSNGEGEICPTSNSGGTSTVLYEALANTGKSQGGHNDISLSDDMEVGYQTRVDWFHPSSDPEVPPADVDKVRCIVRNIVRDWTEEGAIERAQCYTPILEELEFWFPQHIRKERQPSCLIPGAGLARLACEISMMGFMSQGNEFSYFMMICSSFILNHTLGPLEWVLHPWIHNNCNNFLNHDQLRAVRFPDLHPGSAGITEGFSMCAGDFLEVYSHPSQVEAWDAVVTCFFIDTAHNVLEYLEIIARILKPGGVWINLGPLLYHFADAHRDASSFDSEEEMSMELSLADVRKIAMHYGLKMQKEKIIETTYSANIRAMMQNRYYAAFWTMTK